MPHIVPENLEVQETPRLYLTHSCPHARVAASHAWHEWLSFPPQRPTLPFFLPDCCWYYSIHIDLGSLISPSCWFSTCSQQGQLGPAAGSFSLVKSIVSGGLNTHLVAGPWPRPLQTIQSKHECLLVLRISSGSSLVWWCRTVISDFWEAEAGAK